MIDPRELRLGNYILSDGGDYCQVGGIPCTDRDEWAEHLHPIPLTEDILLKCGFEKKEYSKGDYNKREYCYYNSEEDIYLSLGFELLYESFDDCHDTFYLYESSRKINSLHLLQNYIYFKTEKELEVKL